MASLVRRSAAFVILVATVFMPDVWGQEPGDWQTAEARRLARTYLAEGAGGPVDVDRLAAAIGRRMASDGASAVPAEDLALLALLLARSGVRAQPTATPQDEAESRELTQGDEVAGMDMEKGQEGFAQGLERLEQLPLSERLVITGDIAAGVQAAPLSGTADLSSAFGRVRMNIVARAVSGSPSSRFGEGYFFAQMLSAGGAASTASVGGAGSFSPLNDIATDRSAFNEGLFGGNLYIGKAFYQQELDAFDGRAVGRVGIIDVTDYFDTNEFANNEMRQFMNSSLVNAPSFKGGLIAPGAMADYARPVDEGVVDGLAVRAGYVMSRSERAFASPLWMMEAELRTLMAGRSGAWRFGGTLGNVAGVGRVASFHFSGDQWLTRHSGLFARYSVSSSQPGSVGIGPIAKTYSIGFQRRFMDEADHASAWGIGMTHSIPFRLGNPMLSETVLETYYRWQITNELSITPDLQWVTGAGGRADRPTHPVFGLRVTAGL